MLSEDPIHRIHLDDVTWQVVGDESVVLDLKSSVYYTGNVTATVLWGRLLEGATAGQLVDALTDEFEVERDQAQRDVAAFLDELRSAGFLIGR